MSKPDWKDAPERARWLACDLCGVWFWYEYEPSIYRWSFSTNDGDSVAYAGYQNGENNDWKETLERRP